MVQERSRLAWIGAIAALGVCALTVAMALAPPRSGPLALASIFAPYLFLPLLVLVPFAVARGRTVLRIALVVAAIVFVARFVPDWLGSPGSAPGGSVELAVTSWNLELGAPSTSAVLGALETADAGVIGIQELTPTHAAAIRADRTLHERFPYQVLFPSGGSQGIGLLSSFPFVGQPTYATDPAVLDATLVLPGSRELSVVVAHPEPARIGLIGDLPFILDYDPAVRDRHIRDLRATVDPLLAAGRRVLLFGDLNTVEREPVWPTLAAGLVDVGDAAGVGPGFTWRPHELEWLPFGLLRIDHVLVGGGVVPLSSGPDCTPRGSDHCIVHASVAVP